MWLNTLMANEVPLSVDIGEESPDGPLDVGRSISASTKLSRVLSIWDVCVGEAVLRIRGFVSPIV